MRVLPSTLVNIISHILVENVSFLLTHIRLMSIPLECIIYLYELNILGFPLLHPLSFNYHIKINIIIVSVLKILGTGLFASTIMSLFPIILLDPRSFLEYENLKKGTPFS